MQDVAAADGVARDHRDHRLGRAADLDLQIQDVEPRHAVGADVAAAPARAVVAAAAERVGAGAGQHDDADGRVVARVGEAPGHLHDGARAERVALLGAVDDDLVGW